MPASRTPALVIASVALLALLAMSGLHPFDRATWWLEIFPALLLLSRVHDRQIAALPSQQGRSK